VRVSGWGTSNDANHLTGPSRDGSGLVLAIFRALARAGVAPDSIDYINAHGTGTPYNDNMEALALRAVFGRRVPPFSSSKGMLGHTLGAAGILETILCLAAMQAQLLPGTPRLRERDPAAPESLLDHSRPASGLRRILKINCGFGGTNGALVLERELP
jgi:3-oxoacyl-(acyl-carrier-protein) synthase